MLSLFLKPYSVSECCATPYSLLGLTFVVSYLALGLLNLCKFYLGGYAAVQNENVMHRWDVISGFVLSPINPFLPIFHKNPAVKHFCAIYYMIYIELVGQQ